MPLKFKTSKPKTEVKTEIEKPKSLQEKVDGFKFTKPNATNGRTEADRSVSGNAIQGNDAGSAEGKTKLSFGKSKPETNTASKPVQMSADKYEVVIGDKAELSEEAGNAFQQQLEMLQSAIDGEGDLKDGMENILLFLDDNPQYKENVFPHDVAVFVAACRKVAGITVQEKQTRTTRKKKVDVDVADVLSELADLDF